MINLGLWARDNLGGLLSSAASSSWIFAESGGLPWRRSQNILHRIPRGASSWWVLCPWWTASPGRWRWRWWWWWLQKLPSFSSELKSGSKPDGPPSPGAWSGTPRWTSFPPLSGSSWRQMPSPAGPPGSPMASSSSSKQEGGGGGSTG